jgi:hypothetical protein
VIDLPARFGGWFSASAVTWWVSSIWIADCGGDHSGGEVGPGRSLLSLVLQGRWRRGRLPS